MVPGKGVWRRKWRQGKKGGREGQKKRDRERREEARLEHVERVGRGRERGRGVRETEKMESPFIHEPSLYLDVTRQPLGRAQRKC